MSAFAELQSVLQKLTYKPDWNFEAYETLGVIYLKVSMFVVNVNDTSSMIRVYHVVQCPGFHESALYRVQDWVYEQILVLEKHETREWFKIDGVQVKEPHPV